MSPQSSSGERTERATPKKRRDARERGQILKSTEVNSAFCCAIIFGFMLLYSETMVMRLGELLQYYLGDGLLYLSGIVLSRRELQTMFINLAPSLAVLLLPILFTALLAGLLINVVQVGFNFTVKPLMPKLERISPLKGLKRIFSAKTLSELIKSLVKIICLGWLFYSSFKQLLFQFPSFTGANIAAVFLQILKMAFTLALKMTLILAIVAVFDYLFQWWSFEKELRMTKQEVKDEYKLTEGDPQIKSRIRAKQRQMSAMRMMEQVPQADVVITNPTHYAVALAYRPGEDLAPLVVAKGQDFLAGKIKEVARQHGITMVENVELARSLYQFGEVGSEIPMEFYQAVADILVYVYGLKNKFPYNRR
ncbi:MAG: flagellar biosynthesis protein FlhB [Clostridiales bacterium]|nr:flagellar biosynthesis protein FlhB [Clostridiales bacterium]